MTGGWGQGISVITTFAELQRAGLPPVLGGPYSESFFETGYLVIVRQWYPSGGTRHRVDSIDENGNIQISRTQQGPGVAIPVTSHILIELCRNFKPEQFNTVFVAHIGNLVLSPFFDHIFLTASVGYGPQAPHTVTVRNTGTMPSTELSISLSYPFGGVRDTFTLDQTTIPSIPAGGTATFTITPNEGLAPGMHRAMVRAGNSSFFSVSFTVET